jgi:hypothetical protein
MLHRCANEIDRLLAKFGFVPYGDPGALTRHWQFDWPPMTASVDEYVASVWLVSPEVYLSRVNVYGPYWSYALAPGYPVLDAVYSLKLSLKELGHMMGRTNRPWRRRLPPSPETSRRRKKKVVVL